MNILFKTAVITLLILSGSPDLYASKKASHAVTICKAEASVLFADEKGYKHRKVKRIKDKPSYTNVSFSIYPDSSDMIVAVCKVTKRDGKIVSFDVNQ